MINNAEKEFNIEKLGCFSLYDILMEVGYPTLFICKDVFSAFYLFYETDYDQDRNEWLIMKISKIQYWDLKVGNKSLQDTFRSSLGKKWYVFKEIKNQQEITIQNEFPENYFPFIKPIFVNKTEFSSSNYLVKESYDKEQPIFDIKLHTESPVKEVSIEPQLLENYSKNIRLFFKDYGISDSSMKLSLEKGSTIIRFTFEQENLFSNNDVSNSFASLNKALNSKEAKDIVDAFKGDKGKITKFRELVDTIRKTNKNVSIIASSSSNESQIFKVINKTSIAEYKKYIDNIVVEEKPIIRNIVGYVYSVNTENKKIEFIQNNKKIKAELSENLSHEQMLVNETYLLEVSEHSYSYLNGQVKDIKYKVINATPKS